MLVEVENPNTEVIWHLFRRHRRMRTVIRSVLELNTGTVFADSPKDPAMGALVYPPLILMAGNHSLEISSKYIESLPELTPVVFPTASWELLFRRIWGSMTMGQKRTRFSPKGLSLKHIRKLGSQIPPDFMVERLADEDISELNQDLLQPIKNFYGVERFVREGIGFCAKNANLIASMAHTAFPFVEDFEVQVTTINDPKYRRRGLATATSCALIEYALENGLVPHWDAANEVSVYLAMKLGYTNPDEYFVYFWKR